MREFAKPTTISPMLLLKPVESAGSDDVTLCKSVEEVKAAFGNIMGKRNNLGQINEAVLVQVRSSLNANQHQ